MDLDRYTPTEIAEGEVVLATILPVLKSHGLTGQPPFGGPLTDRFQHYALHNYQAFIVTTRNGGWVADLLLRNVPYGVPDVVGTSDRFPFSTYAQAFEAGLAILVQLLAMAQSSSPSGS